MAAQITADACKVDCSTLASSTYVDCGPVQPATAVGGKFLGLMKSCVRFAATLPVRCLEWAQSFTLVTFSTILFLVAAYTMTSLSFFGTRSVCLSTTGVWWHFQSKSVRLRASTEKVKWEKCSARIGDLVRS